MTNRELIELLAKENWDAEVKIKVGRFHEIEVSTNYSVAHSKEILSVSSFAHNDKQVVTININEE